MAIAVLGCCLGRSGYVVTSTSTDFSAVITEDGYYEEEIQESRKYIEIQEVVEVGYQTDSSGSTSPTISK